MDTAIRRQILMVSKGKMIFTGIDQQTVELSITNYEFPDINNHWDANWLLVYLKVQSKLGNWQTIDPSLTTWELQELIEWFLDLADDQKPELNPMEFTEPNLSFHHLYALDNKKIIRIRFELESRPQSASDDREYFVDCDLTNSDLQEIAEELTKELARFPKRPL
ncbi:WapI family immunity protein [Flavilitoribacter nigricans]|nr:hypothetical protein [Flavilitoribacter nigricans]